MQRPVSDVLAEVQRVNQRIGPLCIELLNTEHGSEQTAKLRELGSHVGSLSAELLARAAELDGRMIGTSSLSSSTRRNNAPGRCGSSAGRAASPTAAPRIGQVPDTRMFPRLRPWQTGETYDMNRHLPSGAGKEAASSRK